MTIPSIDLSGSSMSSKPQENLQQPKVCWHQNVTTIASVCSVVGIVIIGISDIMMSRSIYSNSRIDNQGTELRDDIKDLRTELRNDNKELRTEFREGIEELKNDNKELRNDFIAAIKELKS